jgi:hypothetical protein
MLRAKFLASDCYGSALCRLICALVWAVHGRTGHGIFAETLGGREDPSAIGGPVRFTCNHQRHEFSISNANVVVTDVDSMSEKVRRHFTLKPATGTIISMSTPSA